LLRGLGFGVEVRVLGLGGGGRFGSRFFLHLEGSGSAIVVFCVVGGVVGKEKEKEKVKEREKGNGKK
jgi:hypothetical protein